MIKTTILISHKASRCLNHFSKWDLKVTFLTDKINKCK